ncbi:MAG TPA: AraC family transcriptional regulator [Polyangiaceae bacterium]|nr:AraC family transcriptional regulator [Polyangiaceae bacterium]
MAVHRLSSLPDVEFWSVKGGVRPRTQLSDMFSATLVLGAPDDAECGRVWARGKDRPFRPGDILLAEADEVQRITPTDRPSASFTIFWSKSAFESAAREGGQFGPPQWAVTQLCAGPVSAELAALHALLEANGEPETILQAFRAATIALLHTANSGGRSASRVPSHPAVRRAVRRVKGNVAESLSLEDLAAELRMSKCHLARCFERTLGVPPHRYRRLLRLRAARRLLEAGLSVSEAAGETGFADAPHLTRAFRDWLGVSPAAWGSAWRASNPWVKDIPQTLPPPKPD